jgi:4-carboxymuconolactone decarboxylase
MHVARGQNVSPQPAVRDIFTGEVNTHTFAGDDVSERLRLNLVKFSPGARTKWHRHTFEQGLIITEGRGIVATEEHEHVVGAGDVVIVYAEEKHWHGATETTAMAHIAINQPGETEVLEAVDHIRTPAS